MRMHALLAWAGVMTAPAHAYGAPQSDSDRVVNLSHHYRLNCRGGEGLVFDTITPPSDTGRALGLSLAFVASPTAAGPEGLGLPPSTCAWVDRPMNDEEPRHVRVTVHISDSTPRATVRDTGVYWSFLAHHSDSGHFTAVGYRYWHASWPPLRHAGQAPVAAPTKGSWLPFDPLYFPLLVIAWVVIAWVPFLTLCGRWSGWRRLAGFYPYREIRGGGSFRSGPTVMGMTNYRGGARLTADDTHLHFSMSAPLRPGHPPFSVPWPDITASRDEWPWFPLKGHPVIRLTLARHRSLRILVPVADGERIVAGSAGRLQLSEPSVPAGAAH